MMRRENGRRVVIDISEEEFDVLMIALGIAAGSRIGQRESAREIFRLVNTINEGNPDFTPYEISDDAKPS